MSGTQKFYQSMWFIILALIIFFPIGLFLMWRYEKFNKMARIIITVLFLLIFLSTFGNKNKETQPIDSVAEYTNTETTEDISQQESEPSQSDLNTSIEELHNRFNEDGTFKLEAVPNSSASVDEILRKAKEDCMPDETYSEIDQAYALAKIKELNYEYYTNRSTMELVMYLGRILEVSPEQKVATLGTDVIQAVKYVYRNEETVENVSTQANLEQIRKDLALLDGEEDVTSQNANNVDINNEKNDEIETEEMTTNTSGEVYITPTGKKYHYDNSCNGGTYILSTLEAAQSKGLTPCKKCAY